MMTRLAAVVAVALLGMMSVPVTAQTGAVAPKEPALAQWLGTLTLARPELYDPARWSNEENQIGAAHFSYWKQLTQKGAVILVGRTLDEDGKGRLASDAVGLIIFEAHDPPGAVRMLTDDPGVKSGLWRYRLNSYRIALTR